MPLLDLPMSFEVADAQDKTALFKVVIRSTTTALDQQLGPGEEAVELTMSLRQALPLSAQLSLIRTAAEALRRMERALVSGDTGGQLVSMTMKGPIKA